MLDRQLEYALVLSGGGARGAYQIGVWKAMRELGLKINAVSGTSVGSINAAFVASDDFERCYKIWNSLTMEMVYTPKKHIGPLEIGALRERLKETLDIQKLKNSPVEYCLVTYNLTKKQPVIVFKKEIADEQFIDYIMASANFPVFKRETIGEDAFIDGGFADNMPVLPLAQKGYKNFIVVDVRDALTTLLQQNPDEQYHAILLQCRHSLGSILSFDQTSIQENIFKGYHDLLKIEGRTTGFYYYIQNNASAHDIHLTKTEIANLSKDPLVQKASKKAVALGALRTLNAFARTTKDLRILDDDFYMLLIEYCAQLVKIELITLYDFKQLQTALYNKLIQIKQLGEMMQQAKVYEVLQTLKKQADKSTASAANELILASIFAAADNNTPYLQWLSVAAAPYLIVYCVYLLLKNRMANENTIEK